MKEFFYNLKLSNEILLWVIHLENFLKLKDSNLKFDFLHLGFELKEGKINLSSYTEFDRFSNQMDHLLTGIDFTIDATTLICITCTTSYHFLSSKLIAEYFHKNYKETVIIIGGTHATVKPEDFNHNNSPFDYIILGEGELSLYNLIKNGKKKKLLPEKLYNPPIIDMNILPPLNYQIYEKYLDNYNNLSLFLSRGCPFNCNFCIEKNLRGRTDSRIPKWRPYSPKNAIKNIEYVIQLGLEHNIKTFGIYDPIFGLDNVWLNQFLEHFNPDDEILNIFTETRFDHLNKTLIKKFLGKKFTFFFGLESFSKKMLGILNKTAKPIKYLERFEDIRMNLTEMEQPYFVSILMNHLGEAKETSDETLKKILEIKKKDRNDLANFSFTTYYAVPGSFTYENQNYFAKTYGSKIFFPEWWKVEDKLKYGAIMVKPSKNFSVKDALENYIDSAIMVKKLGIEQLRKYKTPNFFEKGLLLKGEIKDLEAMRNNFQDVLSLKYNIKDS